MSIIKRVLFFTLFFFSLLFSKAYGQYIFDDAKALRALIHDDNHKWNQSDKDSVARILAHYCSPDDVGSVFFTSNPFIKPFAIDITDKSAFTGVSLPVIGSSVIGGLDVTKYANALAALMIKRAKEELTVAFFDRFKKLSAENPEFQILFPKTKENLAHLLSYKYPQMLPALRKGFFEDLKQVADHLDDVIDLPRYRSLLKDFPVIRVCIRSIRVIHELETGASNAAEVINEMSEFEEWSPKQPGKMEVAGAVIKIAALFSESVRNNAYASGTEDIWVAASDLKAIFYDDILFKLYLGLVYQQADNNKIQWTEDGSLKKFSKVLGDHKDDLFLIQNKLKEFFDLAATVNTAYKNFKVKTDNKQKPSDEDIYNYISTSIDVVDYGLGIASIFHEMPAAGDYLSIARQSNELFKSIYTKAYTQAVTGAFGIFVTIDSLVYKQKDLAAVKASKSVANYKGTSQNDLAKLATGHTFLSNVTDKNIDNVTALNSNDPDIVQLTAHYNLHRLIVIIEKIKPYALFMANVVEAQGEADVTAALDAVILPVGSSSIKKYTKGNISIQSYLGAFYNTSNANAKLDGAWSDKYGVTAPVGISWTPGFASRKKGGSFSLFTSLIDIGAIVDYKLKKEPDAASNDPNATIVSKDYKIQLGQIFSPGVYIVYGAAWKLPLALGFGAQYGPGLSKIDAGNNTVVTNPYWRWTLFLAVDLPFFNVVNKPADKQ